MKSSLVAYVLWLFLGVSGVHRFYLGRIGTGFIWLFTGGLFGIGWLVDIFLIPQMVDEANAEYVSLRRAYANDPLPPPHPTVAAFAQGQPPTPVPPMAEGYQVFFCTRCGSPMQVPESSTGKPFACPRCYMVLRIPA